MTRRDYRFIDPQNLEEVDVEPVHGPPEWLLKEGLLDLIQLSESEEDVAPHEVDKILRDILEERIHNRKLDRPKHSGFRVLRGGN